MNPMDACCEFDFIVRWSETGPGGWMKPATWLDVCMEASDIHARRLKLSMTDVMAMGYYWVMSRYRLVFEESPHARDCIHVKTWPRGFEKLFTLRDFVFSTPGGVPLGRGTAAWLLVKKDTFRPLRAHEHLPTFPMSAQIGYNADFSPLPSFSEKSATQHQLIVRRDEIDLLGHVSNPHYIRWAIEALPHNLLSTHRMAQLEVDFIGMAFEGESIEAQTKGEETTDGSLAFHQILRRVGETRDLTRLRTRWVPRR